MSSCGSCELFARKYDSDIDEFYGQCQHPRKIEQPKEFTIPCKYHRKKTTQLQLD